MSFEIRKGERAALVRGDLTVAPDPGCTFRTAGGAFEKYRCSGPASRDFYLISLGRGPSSQGFEGSPGGF